MNRPRGGMEGGQRQRYYARRPSVETGIPNSVSLRRADLEAQAPQMQEYGSDEQDNLDTAAYSYKESYVQTAPHQNSNYPQNDDHKPAYFTKVDPSTSAAGHRNSRSYASRARARPELSLETSPASLSDPPASSVASSGRDHPIVRRESVPDRSPLQKLEVTLGDITKEEKRARLEEAENLARQRGVASNVHSSSGRSVSLSDGFNRGIVRKPVSGSRKESSSYSDHVGHQEGIRHGTAYDHTPDTMHSQAVLTTSAYHDSSLGAHTDVIESSLIQDDSRLQDRRYGHDATLTSGAAAAAAGAYQAAKRHQHEFSRSTTNTVDLVEHYGLGNRNASQQPLADDNRNTGRSGTLLQQTERASGDRDTSRLPDGYIQLQSDELGIQAGVRGAQGFHEPNPVPRQQVMIDPTGGSNHVIPPQAAGGQHVRRQVNFGGEVHDAMRSSGHQTSTSQHISDLLHPDQEPLRQRSFKAFSSLDEWKSAGTARLTAEDLDTPGTSEQAWSEKEGDGRQHHGQDTQSGLPATSYDGLLENESPSTTFSPALMLKCGPLLRYNGLRRLHSVSEQEQSRAVWRGSVMIVTEDQFSSYSTVPTLRLFKQPMDLVGAPGAFLNGYNHLVPDQVDPLAGHLKVGRTGRSLFVKPVRHLRPGVDLSRIENDEGLFERVSTAENGRGPLSRISGTHRSKLGRYREVKGFRLHVENGCTFWRFNIEVELGSGQARIAYRINGGPGIGFWVPARDQPMNIMFHSCNGFSMSVNPNEFCGPDPLWRDVLNNHMIRPFHAMLGGGDQIYNDVAMRSTEHFQNWLSITNPVHKHNADFTGEMQEELERFYLNRYAMWFSQGLFGLANSQIPMINMWDDHDIIDGYGSYPHHFMKTAVFTGLGAVAFKYYMLFQHQSVVGEDDSSEPSWLLGAAPGSYINELSRSLFMFLGSSVALLALDCRTERTRDSVLSQETYDLVFDRCRREIAVGETKHLIVLLGIPIAYPRLNFLENVLTSKAMDPIKALARRGLLGGLVNKFDGGVEILDDLDDHWTAKHHKDERNWFIQELQELAAEKSVRVTILGGDVHLAAVGQFYSREKLGIPKDQDYRYMPNVISSAIVNTPPPELTADILNRRNKVHHLDQDTDEDMIPLFTHDVNGKSRNNVHLLPRRNWCSIREYCPGEALPSSPRTPPQVDGEPKVRRSFSLTGRRSPLSRSTSLDGNSIRRPSLLRRLSGSARGAPSSFRGPIEMAGVSGGPYASNGLDPRVDGPLSRGNAGENMGSRQDRGLDGNIEDTHHFPELSRSGSFHRRPSRLGRKAASRDRSGREGYVNLHGGLDVSIHCEVNQKDPAGTTIPYRLLIPALFYHPGVDMGKEDVRERVSSLFGSLSRRRSGKNHENTEYTNNRDTQPRQPVLNNHDRSTHTAAHGRNYHDLPIYNEHKTMPQEVPTVKREETKETTFNLLPRSREVPETSTPAPRPLLETYRSARGPEPPSNLDELPPSVRKRYSQFDAEPYGYDTGKRSNEYYPRQPSNLTNATSRDRHDRRVFGNPPSFSRPFQHASTQPSNSAVTGPPETPYTRFHQEPPYDSFESTSGRVATIHHAPPSMPAQHPRSTTGAAFTGSNPSANVGVNSSTTVPLHQHSPLTSASTAYTHDQVIQQYDNSYQRNNVLFQIDSTNRNAYMTYGGSPKVSPAVLPRQSRLAPQSQSRLQEDTAQRRASKFQRHYMGPEGNDNQEHVRSLVDNDQKAANHGRKETQFDGKDDGLDDYDDDHDHALPVRPMEAARSEKAERLLGMNEKSQRESLAYGPGHEQGFLHRQGHDLKDDQGGQLFGQLSVEQQADGRAGESRRSGSFFGRRSEKSPNRGGRQKSYSEGQDYAQPAGEGNSNWKSWRWWLDDH